MTMKFFVVILTLLSFNMNMGFAAPRGPPKSNAQILNEFTTQVNKYRDSIKTYAISSKANQSATTKALEKCMVKDHNAKFDSLVEKYKSESSLCFQKSNEMLKQCIDKVKQGKLSEAQKLFKSAKACVSKS